MQCVRSWRLWVRQCLICLYGRTATWFQRWLSIIFGRRSRRFDEKSSYSPTFFLLKRKKSLVPKRWPNLPNLPWTVGNSAERWLDFGTQASKNRSNPHRDSGILAPNAQCAVALRIFYPHTRHTRHSAPIFGYRAKDSSDFYSRMFQSPTIFQPNSRHSTANSADLATASAQAIFSL